MRALRYYGKEDIRLDEDVPEPKLRRGTIQLRPAWNGICGSDLKLYVDGPEYPMPTQDVPHPLTGETLPIIFGHEFSAVVEDIGEGVEGFSVGDSVAVEPMITCGQCAPCRADRYNICEKLGFLGASGVGGGLSERIVLKPRWVHPVGDIPLDQAALIEPLAVAVHAVRRSGAREGDVAVVGGAGPIGLFTASALKALGATVVLTEVAAARKAKALSTGLSDYVLDPLVDDVKGAISTLTSGRGADVAFDCAGVQSVLTMLVDCLRVDGTLQAVAWHKTDPAVPIIPVLFKELTIRGAIGYANDHARAISLVRDGKVDLSPFITKKVKATNFVTDGVLELINNKDDHVKILIEM